MISTDAYGFAGTFSPDGKYLFFHRRVNDKGDIYWVSSNIIDDIREVVFQDFK